MRIAYLDGFSGISGDMFMGALVDLGVPFELLQRTVAGLHIDAALEQSRVERNGISATKIDVLVSGQKDLPREEFWTAHTEVTQHTHTSGGSLHNHESAGSAEHPHPHGRKLSGILNIVNNALISEHAKHTATMIFTALGEAEAKVHNTDVDNVHFHEVGAVDAIVDIVCAAVGAEALRVESILASPLNVGGGTVKCAHGVVPVPAPATLELLKGIPVYSGEVQKELVTPTGAAIARVLAKSFGPRPLMTTVTIGYGAGSRDFAGHSNVLRLTVGDTVESGMLSRDPDESVPEDDVVVLEANLDDLSPQIVGYVMDRVASPKGLWTCLPPRCK